MEEQFEQKQQYKQNSFIISKKNVIFLVKNKPRKSKIEEYPTLFRRHTFPSDFKKIKYQKNIWHKRFKPLSKLLLLKRQLKIEQELKIKKKALQEGLFHSVNSFNKIQYSSHSNKQILTQAQLAAQVPPYPTSNNQFNLQTSPQTCLSSKIFPSYQQEQTKQHHNPNYQSEAPIQVNIKRSFFQNTKQSQPNLFQKQQYSQNDHSYPQKNMNNQNNGYTSPYIEQSKQLNQNNDHLPTQKYYAPSLLLKSNSQVVNEQYSRNFQYGINVWGKRNTNSCSQPILSQKYQQQQYQCDNYQTQYFASNNDCNQKEQIQDLNLIDESQIKQKQDSCSPPSTIDSSYICSPLQNEKNTLIFPAKQQETEDFSLNEQLDQEQEYDNQSDEKCYFSLKMSKFPLNQFEQQEEELQNNTLNDQNYNHFSDHFYEIKNSQDKNFIISDGFLPNNNSLFSAQSKSPSYYQDNLAFTDRCFY